MSRTHSLVAPFVVLIIAVLLVVGGLAIHRIGWSEGYQMGQLAATVGHDMTVPYSLGWPGLFLALGVAFLVLVVVGKFLRFWAWTTIWGPQTAAGAPSNKADDWHHAHWARHWPHGPMPPWFRGWDIPAEDKGVQGEAQAEAGAGQAAGQPAE
jgi:hypothetical protein